MDLKTRSRFDFFLALVSLVCFFPFLLAVAIVLVLSGERRVFFFQERIGRYHRPFRIWKFSTMREAAPGESASDVVLADDPRLTRIGFFLRRTRINELPQLINVLRGEMSLVGPRPLTHNSFDDYSEAVKRDIFPLKPGITGIGSLIFRDETTMLSHCNGDPDLFYRQEVLPYKGRLEQWYSHHRSLPLDLFLLLVTAVALFFPVQNLLFRLFPDLPQRPDFLIDFRSSVAVRKL